MGDHWDIQRDPQVTGAGHRVYTIQYMHIWKTCESASEVHMKDCIFNRSRNIICKTTQYL